MAKESTLTLFAERITTPTGPMLLLTDEKDRVRALDWEDHKNRIERFLTLHYGADGMAIHDRARRSSASKVVESYFDGDLTGIDRLAVATGGTPFQRDVWAALRTIRAGTTLSYSELANVIGRPKAIRAVGLANGSNPIGIIVPCHRVIGADSSLTGYGGGLPRKRWLLEHEGVLIPLRPAPRAAAGSWA